jgi:predicted PurR-regulated permease PerM
MTANRTTPTAITRLQPAVDRSRAEWRLLRTRLTTITPQALGRGLLAATVILVGGWLATLTWPALLPFAVGGLVAYTIYPLVNSLDRFMPRVLAAGLALAAGLTALVLLVAVVVPPLVSVSIQVLRDIPNSSQVADLRAQFDAYLATLPEGARALVQSVVDRVAAIAAEGLSSFLDSIASLIVTGVLGIFDTIGFIIGLVLLPLWILSVVRDGRALRGQIAAQFAPGVRADAMALLTIVHRAMSTFLRVQLAAAFAVGALVYGGILLVQQTGSVTVVDQMRALSTAVLMGAAQVIPQLGSLIGLLPIVLVAIVRPDQPQAALAMLIIYLVSLQLVNMAVGGRLGRDLKVPNALALPAFAVISQIGLVWLLLSAPILVIARNTVRYLRGRLAEPPRPAGLLPWERAATRPGATMPAPVPPVYRDAATAGGPQQVGGGGGQPRLSTAGAAIAASAAAAAGAIRATAASVRPTAPASSAVAAGSTSIPTSVPSRAPGGSPQ